MSGTARLGSHLLAGFITGLGVFVLLGWHLHLPAFVQVSPQYVAMPYGAALGFLLTGLGMLAVLRRLRRIAAAFGIVLTVVAGLPLLQHLYGVFPQIDNLLVHPFAVEGMPVSERTPFSAAFSLTLVGLFLACSLLKITPQARLRFHWVLGAWLVMLGLLSLTGYIADLYDGYGRGGQTKLALYASIGFLVTGLAIIASRLDRPLGAMLKSNRRLLAMGALVMMVIAIFNWKIIATWEYRRIDEVMLGFSALLMTVFVWVLISYHNQIRLRRHLNSVLEATPSALIESDMRGRIIMVNSAAEKLFGYTAKELMNMHVEDLVPGQLRDEHAAFRQEFYARPYDTQMVAGRDLLAVDKNGREIPVEIGLNAVHTEEGVRVLSAIVDVSERKHHEETIAQHARKLETVNEELEQFAYTASHDLKSPLRAIENLAAWIDEDAGGVLPEKSREDLALLRNRVARMNRLLDSLLEYSRLGRLDYRHEDIDCAALMKEIAGVMNVPENFSIEIEDTLPVIYAPRAPLELVLRNLIGNAIKHHDRGQGTIRVSILDCGKYAEIHVRDDGPGILPKFHRQIFQIFQTLKPRDAAGSGGMGLSMVKKIVEGYGGSVEIQSDPSVERGAEFIVRWPYREK